MVPEIHVGHRLRIAREESGYESKQAAFAELIGISPTTLTRYEKGYTKPKTIALRAWSLATGVPVEWLLHGTVEVPDSGPERRQAAAGGGGARPEGFEPPTF